ncbi:proline/betaine transporter [Rickettsia asembonensis]|nr:proline/betaine transporter [Rickettsia asembonensis]
MDQKIRSVSSRGLTTVSKKNNKDTNNFSIFNWIPQSSRGMTGVS